MLDVPKLRGATFQTAVIERYRRRETSVEEAIMEMYLTGVSTRRIEDVSEIPWGAGVSAGIAPNLNEKAFESVDAWRTRSLSGGYPYLFVDGIYPKRSRGGSCENVAAMVAIGVNSEGRREIVGCAEGFAESKESWKEFLLRLRGHGLSGARLVAGDKSPGMLGTLEGFSRGEIPAVHRPLLPQRVRQGAEAEADEGRQDAQGHPCAGIARGVGGEGVRGGRLARVDEAIRAAKVVREGFAETLTYCEMPREHWRRIRTNNAIERPNREIRRRTRVAGTFPDGKSALMPVAARLRYIVENEWGRRRYLDISLLEEKEGRM